jgi:ABC-type polysaccharide/polyol phosphate export permease
MEELTLDDIKAFLALLVGIGFWFIGILWTIKGL